MSLLPLIVIGAFVVVIGICLFAWVYRKRSNNP